MIDAGHAFIESEERSYYTSMIARLYTGKGVIVDAGCFSGASTLALCRGLFNSRSVGPTRRPVIAIDRFVVEDRYIAEHFSEYGVDIRYGESFLPVFTDTVKEFLGFVEIRAGDLIQVGRIEVPIECLVVDVAKSPALSAYIARQWFPKLIPGVSRVFQQDLHSPAQPWIAALMGGLLDFFSIEDARVGEGACFRLERPIAPNDIEKALGRASEGNGISAIERLCEALNFEDSLAIRITLSMLTMRSGNCKDARIRLAQLLEWRGDELFKKWRKWLSIAIMYIDPAVAYRDRQFASIYTEYLLSRSRGEAVARTEGDA